MRILALDSAVGRCSVTLVADDAVIAGWSQDIDRSQTGVLPIMVRDCLDKANLTARQLDLIAVTVGPGSFTGIRGAIALAQGLALAAARPIVGVTVGEALAESLPQLQERTLWCATISRKGRIFLEIGPELLSCAVTDLPIPTGPVAIAGPAAADVASRLAARGADIMLTDADLPIGRYIARLAERRVRGLIRSLPAEPLYIDPPQAKPPTNRSRVAEV